MTDLRGAAPDGDHLAAVMDALRLSPRLHQLNPAADEMSLLVVEARLGRDLPVGLKRFYEVSDGANLVDGNVGLVPAIGPGEMRLLDYSEWLRDADWPIPEEVLMFGGDGGDELFGVWYPPGASPADPTPVVEIGEIFEPGCMAIVGSDLPVFLRGRIAYHLAYFFESDPTLGPALEAIGLPRELWERATTQQSHRDSVAPYLEWADPTLPTKNPDSYEDRLDPDMVRALLARGNSS